MERISLELLVSIHRVIMLSIIVLLKFCRVVIICPDENASGAALKMLSE